MGHKSRRLDLHQHDPVYKTGAILSRATSAISSARTTWDTKPQVLGHRAIWKVLESAMPTDATAVTQTTKLAFSTRVAAIT